MHVFFDSEKSKTKVRIGLFFFYKNSARKMLENEPEIVQILVVCCVCPDSRSVTMFWIVYKYIPPSFGGGETVLVPKDFVHPSIYDDTGFS